MDVFTAIAEPTRRRILALLAEREQNVNALVDRLGASQTAVSKHLRVLREAKLVRVRVAAQQRWYGIEPTTMQELDRWIEPFRALWAQKLDALEAFLDHGEGADHARLPSFRSGSDRPDDIERSSS